MNDILFNDLCFVKGVVYKVQINFEKNLGPAGRETFVDSVSNFYVIIIMKSIEFKFVKFE